MESTNPKDKIGRTKPPLHLIPPAAEILESVVFGLGAKKYGPFNWRDNTVAASVYISALKRHVAAWWDGQNKDDESGVSHLAHARACLGILIDADANATLLDDRPKPGAASHLIAKHTFSETPVTTASPKTIDLDACGTIDGVTPLPQVLGFELPPPLLHTPLSGFVGLWNFTDMPWSPTCWEVTPDGSVVFIDWDGERRPGVFSLEQIIGRIERGELVANQWRVPA